MKNKENQSIMNINVLKGIPKGIPLWSFFWKEWEYEGEETVLSKKMVSFPSYSLPALQS